jgi:hypothetical protein
LRDEIQDLQQVFLSRRQVVNGKLNGHSDAFSALRSFDGG